ncbi:toxin VasX [Halomonas sp. CSM-2]|uniref:toxin VasX n=1 Tax=Halomonas sp. CSM-2 TaxID=1975722 RepID=UPI001C38F08B|nr:toxin VasX [Halomonas sp. CSM-2]
MSDSMTEAQRVAESQPDNDPGQAQGQCPLTRTDLQLVPVRYAIAEADEADLAAALPGFSPTHEGTFRRSGIRPIRSGWLYLVHSLMPDEVQVFKVEPDGSGDPVVIKREGSVQVLYSPLELTPLHVSMLRQEAFRDLVMTRVNVGAYCPGNGTSHLLNPDDIASALADDVGDHRRIPEAPEPSGEQNQLDTGSYAWCEAEESDKEWQLAGASSIVAAITSEYKQDSACLIIEDIPGRLKDLSQAWACHAEQQGNWHDNYQTENFAARTIDGFMRLDFSPHAANAGQGNIPEWLGNAENDDQADLRELADLYEKRREREEEVAASSGGHPGFIGGALQPIDEDIDALSEHLAERLGTESEAVKAFVEQSEQAHFNEVIGGNYALAPHGIVDVIRQQELQDFLTYANGLEEGWQTAYREIGQDLAGLLPVWHNYALLLDREDELHISFTSKLEHCAVETLALCGQGDFLSQHYMGDVPTTAHLLHFQPTDTFIETFLTELGGPQKALTQAAALMAAAGALGNYQAWQGTIEQQTGLRFRSIAGLSDEVAADIAGEVYFKEKMLGEAVIKTLLDDAQQMELPQRFANMAGMLPEGQRLMFVERLGLLEMGWDIPDQTVLGKLQQAITKAERSLSQLRRLEQELERYYQEREAEIKQASRRGTSQSHRRAADQYHANNIRNKASEIKQQQQLISEALDELAEHSFPANENGTHALKVGGLSQVATRAALAERTALKELAHQPHETMRSTLDTLIRNEQNEVSVARAMGVLVNGSLSALGAIAACVAMKELLQAERSHERFLEYLGNTVAQGLGTAAALLAIREILVDARHRKLYEGRAFQQVAQAELRAAAGSPAQLERWARVANKAMSAVALVGGVAGAFEMLRQSQKLGRAETQSERLATQVALLGATGTAGGGLFLGSMGLMGKILGAPAAQWRLLLLKFAGPVGWFVAASTLLLVAGDLLASRFSLSPVQRWCQRSYWGQRSEYEGLEEHQQELGKLSGSDPVVERQGVAAPHAGPGPGPAPSDLAFRLTMPGGQLADEETLSFGLWGVPMSGAHQELTRDVLAYSHQASERNGTDVTYHFAPEVLSQFHFVRLVVRLRLNGESSTQVYELHRRGRSLTSEWRRVEALTESFFSSVKIGTWPSMPLTPWAP